MRPRKANPLRHEPVRAVIELDPGAVRIEAPAPAIITQENCTHVGMSRGVFLSTLKRPDFPLPVIAFGKLRGVETAAFVTWLKQHTERPAARGVAAASTPDAGANEFLSELGLRLVAGGAQ